MTISPFEKVEAAPNVNEVVEAVPVQVALAKEAVWSADMVTSEEPSPNFSSHLSVSSDRHCR